MKEKKLEIKIGFTHLDNVIDTVFIEQCLLHFLVLYKENVKECRVEKGAHVIEWSEKDV